MDTSLLTLGAGAPDAALLLNRVAIGLFFAISGYEKLFSARRHASLARTLQDDGVRAVGVMQWLVPAVEFSAGCALVVGLFSALAAFGLGVICVGAVALDAAKRISAWQPIDRLDVVGDLLYLPEVLYCVGLAVVVLAGPGRWSADAAISTQFAIDL
jgi:uncharacterized membrane protein YphA (DoxX/SURF4 family)